MRCFLPFCCVLAYSLPASSADPIPISLKEAVARALRESPDLLLARSEEQKAALAARIARDPFRPKLFAGSGLAYTSGFPMSIEGSAPSVVQARGIAQLFNRPTSYRIAQSQEHSRTAAIDTELKRQEVVARVSLLFLDAARWARVASAIRPQVDALRSAAESVALRVKEGRELEIEAKRAALAVARTLHRLAQIEEEQTFAEASLGMVLGYQDGQRLRPVDAGPLATPVPQSETEAVEAALAESRELRRLESARRAKLQELRSYQASRLPTLDLVAQYGLFARFNNYEDFFRRFQRNNWQLGASIQLPLLPSSVPAAQAAQAETDLRALDTQALQVRSRLAVDARHAFQRLQLAIEGRDLARQDLALAREQLDIVLAQLEEGRATLRQVEDARFAEQERWIAYYDAQFAADQARLNLLAATGNLAAALQ